MQQEFAEIFAIKALAWLGEDDELLGVFLGSTGANSEDLRQAAIRRDGEFLGNVLDFILMNDEWVLRCAQSIDVPPADFVIARAALPGGQLPHWT